MAVDGTLPLEVSELRAAGVVSLVVALAACSATVPFHRSAQVEHASRCTADRIHQRSCPNHPYQCLGELPSGSELIGLIEATRDKPIEDFLERAALEGGDLLVLGPYHQEPMRLGVAPAHPGHIFRRAAVVRLPPLSDESCQAPAKLGAGKRTRDGRWPPLACSSAPCSSATALVPSRRF